MRLSSQDNGWSAGRRGSRYAVGPPPSFSDEEPEEEPEERFRPRASGIGEEEEFPELREEEPRPREEEEEVFEPVRSGPRSARRVADVDLDIVKEYYTPVSLTEACSGEGD